MGYLNQAYFLSMDVFDNQISRMFWSGSNVSMIVLDRAKY